jgi:hypothetical protein
VTTPSNDAGLSAQALVEIASVKGQLQAITQMIQANHEATHQRINDFRTAVETRFTGVETRLNTLERNERGTALRTAGGGALAGALVSAALALINKGP